MSQKAPLLAFSHSVKQNSQPSLFRRPSLTDRFAMGDRKTGLVRISNISKLQPLAGDRVSTGRKYTNTLRRFILQVTGHVSRFVAGRNVQKHIVMSKIMPLKARLLG